MKTGIYAIYKPVGPTSHDIIDEIRKITGVKKVGHAGTLDPLACGILVVGIGREATKNLSETVKKEKEYIAEIKLGEESETDDEEGEKILINFKKIPESEEINSLLSEFTGLINQVPPAYSAVKISGKPAYRYKRQGKQVELRSKKVEVKGIKMLEYKWPLIRLRIIAGPGVYIRSLARDIGRKLGTGGYLHKLERIRVGQFSKENSFTLEDFENINNKKLGCLPKAD